MIIALTNCRSVSFCNGNTRPCRPARAGLGNLVESFQLALDLQLLRDSCA